MRDMIPMTQNYLWDMEKHMTLSHLMKKHLNFKTSILLGIYSELKPLMVPSESNPTVLVPGGHGAWNGEVDGKGLFEMSFDFLVKRQSLLLE